MLAKLFTFRCKDKAIYFINQINPQKKSEKVFCVWKRRKTFIQKPFVGLRLLVIFSAVRFR
jgi:hypothetical protein